MTSTEFRIGMNGERNSSKVLKPPGGGSSDIFGGGSYAQEQFNRRQENQTKDRLFGPSVDAVTPSKSNRMKSDIFGMDEQNVSKQAKKKYVQRNPITGETVEIDLEKNGGKNEEETNDDDEVAKENGDEQSDAVVPPAEESVPAVEVKPNEEIRPVKPTSVRVRQPPGGKSSGIF